ncbi:MAG TPA: hypothetical protein VNO79_16280, partial [Actinomycetota bacterium]|nr:hypothetical protein [Actinomycetota bacterium]
MIEVLGPAGAGKTSLVDAVRRLDPGVRAGVRAPRAVWFALALVRVLPSLPRWLPRARRERWFAWNEVKSIGFLEAWLPRVRRGSGTATLLDHGPLFRLARLEEFGPPLVGSPAFRRWWRRCLEAWLDALDLVVVLDAPDAVLLERVDRRGHWYLSAASPEERGPRRGRRARAAARRRPATSSRPRRGPRPRSRGAE